MTQAQETYDRIEALKAEGLSNADAVRKVAEETGKKEGTIRANQYQHRKKLEGGSGSGGRRGRPRGSKPSGPLSPEDAIQQARGLLEEALAGIDGEIAAAKAEAEAAQARYDDLVANAAERKQSLEAQIKALSPES